MNSKTGIFTSGEAASVRSIFVSFMNTKGGIVIPALVFISETKIDLTLKKSNILYLMPLKKRWSMAYTVCHAPVQVVS